MVQNRAATKFGTSRLYEPRVCRLCHLKVAPSANSRLIQKIRRSTCTVEFWPTFFFATRNFAEISCGPSTTLTLSGREPVYTPIWSKISISKTRFDAWPVFATDFAASGEIADRFLRLGSKMRSNRSSFVYSFPSAKG